MLWKKKTFAHHLPPNKSATLLPKQPLDLQNIPKTSPIFCSFNTNFCPPFFIHLGTPKRLEYLGCYSPRLSVHHTAFGLVWWFQHVSSIWKKCFPPDSESISGKMRDEHWHRKNRWIFVFQKLVDESVITLFHLFLFLGGWFPKPI